MREMARAYTSGEKVFAKMRGYPAWPARIEGIADSTSTNIKYHVLFYGTQQRGICRRQELFPYLENKSKYGKLIKAKGFKEALDQIQGLAPVPELVPKIVDEKYRNGIHNQAIKTTLISNNKINNNVNSSTDKKKAEDRKEKKIVEANNFQTSSEINNDHAIQNCLTPRKHSKPVKCVKIKQKNTIETSNNVCPSDINKNEFGFHLESESGSEQETLNQQRKEETESPSSLNPPSNAQEDQSPSTESPCESSSSKDSPEKQQSSSSSSSTMVSRSGRVIKRKTFHDEIQYTSPKRKKVAHRTEEVRVQNSSNQHVQNEPTQRVQKQINQKIQSLPSPSEQQLASQNVYIRLPSEKKQTARRWLTTENCMTRLDTLVRAQLGMRRANPQQCIRFLEDFSELDLRPLMLMKHPEVVETIKRLRRYVGNANAWKFSEEQKKAFEEYALQIRQKAEYIFDKFSIMFAVQDNTSFLEVFADSVVAFQAKTYHWPLAKIYALVSEPKTKAAKSSTLSKSPKSQKSSKAPKVQTKTKCNQTKMQRRKLNRR